MSVTVSQLAQKIVVQGDTEAKAKLSGMNKAAQETSGGFKGILQSALSIAGGLGIFNLVGQAVGFLKDQVSDTITVTMKHADVAAQTAQAIKSTGDASGLSAQQIATMAEKLSGLTDFSEDTIQSGQNLLLTFTGIGKDVFPMASKAMLDLSQAMGQDTKTSAIQLGKALNDPEKGITALTRVGVTFTEQQKNQIKQMQSVGNVAGAQKIILAELSKEFGGSAEAAGKTFGGQMEILKNKMEDFKIKIGTAVMPILQQFLGWVTSNGLPMLEKFGDWFTNVGVPAIQHFGDMAGKVWKILDNKGLADLITSFQKLGSTISTDLAPVLGPLANSLKTMFTDSGTISGAHNIESAFHNISIAVDATRNALNIAGNVLRTIASVFMTQVWPVLVSIGTFLASSFLPVWNELVTMWQTQIIPAFREMQPILQPLGMLLGGIAMIVGALLVVALSLLVGVIKGVVTAFAALLSGIIQAIGGVIQFVMGLVTFVSGILAFIVDLFTGNWSNLGNDLMAIWNGILNMLGGFGNVFMGIVGGLCMTVAGFFWGLVTGVIDFFKMLFDKLVGHSIIPDMVNSIIDWFKGLPGKAYDAIHSLWDKFVTFFGDLATKCLDLGSNIVKNVADGINNAIHFVTDAITNVTSWISAHLPHSPAKIGPLMHLAEQGASIVDQVSSGMMAGMPKLSTALTALTKPINMSLSPGAMSNGVSLAPIGVSNQQPIIIQNYIDGKQITNNVGPRLIKSGRTNGPLRSGL